MIDRIVVINDIAHPGGGASALALASAAEFRKRGFAVTLLSGDAGVNDGLTAAGVEVVGLGGRRLHDAHPVTALLSGLYNRSAEDMVRRWIAKNDTPGTVYHLHGWAQILSPAVFRALRRVRPRLVLSAHDFFLVCPNGSYSFLKTGAVCTLTPMSIACVTANCDRRNYGHKLWRVAREAIHRTLGDLGGAVPVLAIHEAMRPFLVRGGIPPSAIEALPNPVHPYSQLRIEAERNRDVVFVGRLEATKGPDLAAAAARAAGVRLRLIGRGALAETLRADYPDMVFEGFQPPDAVARLVSSARALVMPSRYPEPYGLAAAEALWSGLPVIVSDTAFLAGDVIAAEAGFACDPRDTAAFAALLRRLSEDDALCRRLSLNAFERTRHIGLGMDAWIDRLLAAYGARLARQAA